MARGRYPSDEQRLRTKPHAKVHLRARTHRKTAEAFADPEMRGMLVGLWMLAVESYASRTGDELTLTSSDVQWASGRSQREAGVNALRTLCELVGYSLRVEGKLTLITIRNLSKKQGFHSADSGDTPPEDSALRPPPIPIPTSEHQYKPQKEEKERAATAVARRAPRSASSLFPDPPPIELVQDLTAWAEAHGFTGAQVAYACERVRDWSHGGSKAKSNWPATVRNAMREGWALEGFAGPDGGKDPPRPKSWAEQQEADTMKWIEEWERGRVEINEGGEGAGDLIRRLPDRGN